MPFRSDEVERFLIFVGIGVVVVLAVVAAAILLWWVVLG
jgi:hypothetical protein